MLDLPNASQISVVSKDGTLEAVNDTSAQRTRLRPVVLDGERLEGVFAEIAPRGIDTVLAGGGEKTSVPANLASRAAFLKKWSEAAKKSNAAMRAGTATTLLLTLAACGGEEDEADWENQAGDAETVTIRVGPLDTTVARTDPNTITLVDAEDLLDNEMLTLVGSARTIVTNLIGDLDASGLSGALTITTGDAQSATDIRTGTADVSITGTGTDHAINVNATATTGDVTLGGGRVVHVTTEGANIDAQTNDLTGTLYVDFNMATDTDVNVATGSANTVVYGDNANATINVNAEEMDAGTTLYALEYANVSIDNANETMTVDAGRVESASFSGVLIVESDDDGEADSGDTLAIITGSNQAIVSAADADDTVTIDARELAYADVSLPAAGADWAIGDAGFEVVDGGAFEDIDEGLETLLGTKMVVVSGAADFTVTGLSVDLAGSGLTGDLHVSIKDDGLTYATGDSTEIVAGSGDDTVIGSNANDLLELHNVETVEVGNGNDDIVDHTGDLSEVKLGDGNDDLTFNAAATASIFGGDGFDTLDGRVAEGTYTIEAVEAVDLGAGDDTVTVKALPSGHADLEVADLGAGDDTITFEDGSALEQLMAHGGLQGGAGTDTVNLKVDSTFDLYFGNTTYNSATLSDVTGVETINFLDQGEFGRDLDIELNNGFDNGGDIVFDASSLDAGEQFVAGSNEEFHFDAKDYNGNHNVKAIGGAGDDMFITSANDTHRSKLTFDLSEGGSDIVHILNTTGSVDSSSGLVGSDFDGFGGDYSVYDADPGVGVSMQLNGYNNGTITATANRWNDDGTGYANIEGFTALATSNDMDTVQLDNLTGGFVGEVNRDTTSLNGLANGSVIEINTDSFTISGDQFGTLSTVATMLDSLSNVADGGYYVVAYNGNSENADAGLYYARATEGDGFDFADANGSAGGYDTDSLELLAVFHDVGADTFSSMNFLHTPSQPV